MKPVKWKFWTKKPKTEPVEEVFPSLKADMITVDNIYEFKYHEESNHFKTYFDSAPLVHQAKIDSQFASLNHYFKQQVGVDAQLAQVFAETDPWCLVLEGFFNAAHYHEKNDFVYCQDTGQVFGKFITVSDSGYFRFRTASSWVNSHSGLFSMSKYFNFTQTPVAKPQRDAESVLWDD